MQCWRYVLQRRSSACLSGREFDVARPGQRISSGDSHLAFLVFAQELFAKAHGSTPLGAFFGPCPAKPPSFDHASRSRQATALLEEANLTRPARSTGTGRGSSP